MVAITVYTAVTAEFITRLLLHKPIHRAVDTSTGRLSDFNRGLKLMVAELALASILLFTRYVELRNVFVFIPV